MGIRPDPMMLVAVNCENVKTSKDFYEKLGFVEQVSWCRGEFFEFSEGRQTDVLSYCPQPYPFARPANGAGPFEPAQPKGSAYVAPSPNCMGVLLLPSKKKKVSTNPVFDSLQVVYTPSQSDGDNGDKTLADPSDVKVSFRSVASFEAEERKTR